MTGFFITARTFRATGSLTLNGDDLNRFAITVPQTIRFQNSLLCLLSFYGNMMHAISMYYIPK